MDEDSGDSDSDELDHRYYLWSDYDSYFISNPFLEVVYLFHVKKYIHRKYSLINFTALQLTVFMHLVHLEVPHTEFGSSYFFQITFSENSYDCSTSKEHWSRRRSHIRSQKL